MSSSISVANVDIPAAGKYVVDPARSSLSLTAKHMFGMGTVSAEVTILDGTIDVPEQVQGAIVQARADAASFSSKSRMRDSQVISKKFLDAMNHPHLRYDGRTVERDADGWVLRGQLVARDVEAPLDLRIAELSVQGSSLHLKAEGVADRYAHGVTAMKGMAGRRITITIDAVAQRG